jgi:hypothetical protein
VKIVEAIPEIIGMISESLSQMWDSDFVNNT